MPLRRESRTPILDLGERYGTSYLIPTIRQNIQNGNIQIQQELVLDGKERLDTIAGRIYGDGRLWWILAIGSNIGYALAVVPGTIIKVPKLSDVTKFIS